MSAGCGSCALCCKVMRVDELHKPANQWCAHAEPGASCGGCTIHHERPEICREYECAWLQSQARPTAFGPELRPDRCGVIFNPVAGRADALTAMVDPAKPEAYQRGAAKALIDRLLAAGVQVAVVIGERRKLLIGKRREATAADLQHLSQL